MSAGRICVRTVDTVEPGESVQAAAQRMHARNVGTLVVLNSRKEPVGIVTDRDLAVRVLARGLDPIETTVSRIMTRDLETVTEATAIEDALRVMRSGPVRRIPVVDDKGRLAGLLSLDDVLRLLSEEFQSIGRLLREETPETLANID